MMQCGTGRVGGDRSTCACCCPLGDRGVYTNQPSAIALWPSALRPISEAETTTPNAVILSLPCLHLRREPQVSMKKKKKITIPTRGPWDRHEGSACQHT